MDSLDNIDLLEGERATPIINSTSNGGGAKKDNFRVEISNEKAHQEVERMRNETH